ncbi:Gfo/Idh/MocA family oxidoreductase [Paenibacillus sp. CGMCC 1.16610]|uniref:Gfo/Idh/MocA family oxidoreductase n=1 Tax=Paenibacillus anseongense TaxID=2682845 RepID=A0ABW9UK49_9BACL|nr:MULTISPECIES: Gfo/Idh/MocA family oxidoreductase [Paenibacillus]MBA2941399.1 Gfo/Idh/MocA family oxidoreductase [Paenibacillus sp. CGMCC 1.16610]MVQ40218.1 gfo/Idh/MocA family oxidoreductase [Paenibacillus anseongense]
MSKLQVAVIGAGSISEMHLRSYQGNPDVELYAICDLNEERAKAKAEKYGINRVFTDYKELLADSAIDAVSICTWNNSHAPISIAALEAGKHVLTEKPLCKTVEEALAVEKAVHRSGKTLQVGFVRRYASNTGIVKSFLDHGELGEIYYAKASCIRRLGNPGGWFSDVERSGGGPLIDVGVHVIDLCWYLMGRPKVKSVSGNTYNKLGNRANVKNLAFYKAADYDAIHNTVEDMANALIRFENGASILVDVSFTLHAKEDELTVKLYGDKGGAELEPELSIVTEKYDTILNLTPQINNLSFDFVAGFQQEINYFVEVCQGKKETLSPVQDGVEMMKILCGIYESSRLGKEISF